MLMKQIIFHIAKFSVFAFFITACSIAGTKSLSDNRGLPKNINWISENIRTGDIELCKYSFLNSEKINENNKVLIADFSDKKIAIYHFSLGEIPRLFIDVISSDDKRMKYKYYVGEQNLYGESFIEESINFSHIEDLMRTESLRFNDATDTRCIIILLFNGKNWLGLAGTTAHFDMSSEAGLYPYLLKIVPAN